MVADSLITGKQSDRNEFANAMVDSFIGRLTGVFEHSGTSQAAAALACPEATCPTFRLSLRLERP